MRWSSFTDFPLTNELLSLDLPIFIGIASHDRNAPAEGCDMVIAEFIKAGKTNLSYKHYINCDHGYISNNNGEQINLQSKVAEDIMNWVKKDE